VSGGVAGVAEERQPREEKPERAGQTEAGGSRGGTGGASGAATHTNTQHCQQSLDCERRAIEREAFVCEIDACTRTHNKSESAQPISSAMTHSLDVRNKPPRIPHDSDVWRLAEHFFPDETIRCAS